MTAPAPGVILAPATWVHALVQGDYAGLSIVDRELCRAFVRSIAPSRIVWHGGASFSTMFCTVPALWGAPVECLEYRTVTERPRPDIGAMRAYLATYLVRIDRGDYADAGALLDHLEEDVRAWRA